VRRIGSARNTIPLPAEGRVIDAAVHVVGGVAQVVQMDFHTPRSLARPSTDVDA